MYAAAAAKSLQLYIYVNMGFLGGSNGKEFACNVGDSGFDSWVRKSPWRREWLPTPVFLPGESHGQRSLRGETVWGSKEFDSLCS